MFKCCRLWKIVFIHTVMEIYLGKKKKKNDQRGGSKSNVVRSGL